MVPATGSPEDAASVGDALRRVLAAGADEALSVLPTGPAPLRESLAAAVRPDRPVPDGVALVVPTSGSTGAPTGVLLSAASLRWSARTVNDALGGPPAWVLALPLTHVAGLMVLVRAGLGGAEVSAVDLRRGFTTAGFDEAVAALPPGRAVASLVPTQLARLLADRSEGLTGLAAVLLGGAPTPADLLAQAEAAGVRVVRSYGMTETCGGCVLDGRPLPGVGVRVADGRLRLSGPMLAQARRVAGRDEPLVGPDGWFATPDAGTWDGRRLTVTGRLDDVLVSGGVNVPLAAVETLLASHPDILEAACVGEPDPAWGTRVVAAVVPRDPAAAPTAEQVRAFVQGRAEPAFAPARLVLVEAIPRPAPGKVDRAALRALVEDHS